MQSTLTREYNKIYRNLNGMREMNRLPECLVIVDPTKEKNAVHEARSCWASRLLHLIDTDSDPDMVDLPIPGNDDSLRSIRLVIQHLSDAIKQGRSLRPEDHARRRMIRPSLIQQRAKSRSVDSLIWRSVYIARSPQCCGSLACQSTRTTASLGRRGLYSFAASATASQCIQNR